MLAPLMPKATAVWLIENTSLTFVQIAEFCNLHIFEVEAIANNKIILHSIDPIKLGQVSLEDIEKCEKDPSSKLCLLEQITYGKKKKHSKYTPKAKRIDKPNAILWLLKHCPSLSDKNICSLLGTTQKMILSIKNKNHWNIDNIKPESPIFLGLCTQEDLEYYVNIE